MSISLAMPFRSAGLIYWFDANNPSSNNTLLNNGAAVTSLNNMWNSGINAAQLTGAAQPAYNLNESNGYPSVTFNGTTQYMNVADHVLLRITNAFVFIATIQITSLLSAQQTIFSKGTTPDYAIQINRTAPGQVSFWNGAAWIDSPTNFSKTGTECVVIAVYWTGTSYVFYGNGSNLGSVSNSSAIATSSNGAIIGAKGSVAVTEKLAGAILNTALYNKAMPGQDFTDLYRYFAYPAGLKSI
jgi:hypothetical protein